MPKAQMSDPYYSWVLATDFRGAPPARNRIPLLIECEDAPTAGRLARQLRHPAFDCITPDGPVSRFLTAYPSLKTREQTIQAINAAALRWELGLPFASPDGPGTPHPPAPAGVKPVLAAHPQSAKKLVIGFIDYGCAFAHQQFRQWHNGQASAKTRILSLWDQGADPGEARAPARLAGRAPLNWCQPQKFGYGAQVLREGPPTGTGGAQYLNTYIAGFIANGVLDEERCYALSGYRAIRAPVTHGTHVMDVAAGYPDPTLGPQEPPGAPPDDDLVFVQLPRFFNTKATGSAVQVSGLLRTYVLDAVRYIFDAAGSDAKVIVNLSYGANAGPHTGDSILELALDEALTQRGRDKTRIVVAGGNWYNSDTHAALTLKAGQTKSLVWANIPDNPTDQFIEIWLDGERPAQACRVRLTPPGQEPLDSAWVTPGTEARLPPRGQLLAMVASPARASQSRQGRMVLLAFGPTIARGAHAATPYGDWLIDIHNPGESTVTVNAWCERDDPVFGSGSGPRQARFKTSVTSKCTLSSIGHGQETTVVAGYVANARETGASGAGRASGPVEQGGVVFNPRMSPISSEGPGRPHPGGAKRRAAGPQYLGLSDESDELPGVAAAAVIGRGKVRLDGTSVAAAAITRYFADSTQGLARARPTRRKPPSSGQTTAFPSHPADALPRVRKDANGHWMEDFSPVPRPAPLD
jgi:hypothetical protein